MMWLVLYQVSQISGRDIVYQDSETGLVPGLADRSPYRVIVLCVMYQVWPIGPLDGRMAEL